MNPKETTVNIHKGRGTTANFSHFEEMHGVFWLEDKVWNTEPFFVPHEQERAPKPLTPTTLQIGEEEKYQLHMY